MKVLNVGGGASRDLPSTYKGWSQDLLDIDPAVKPDIVCDAMKMRDLPSAKYDAVFCSHNLEHFYRHQVPQVLEGFDHVLKRTGFVQIAVPDIMALFTSVIEGSKDIDDVWYTSSGGPITFHDVVYGWGKAVSRGNLYYCHKTGFSEKTLTKALKSARFTSVFTASDGCSLHAFAFKVKPTKARLQSLGL